MFPLLHQQEQVRIAERSKALRSGRSPLLWAWVRIPLLTTNLLGILMKKIINLFISNSFEFFIYWFNFSSTSRFYYKVIFKTCDWLILLKRPMLIPFPFFASFVFFPICMTSFLGVVLEKLVGKLNYPASVAQ